MTFTMAGDPDYDCSLAILKALPQAGADLIEIGMPFTDPMADGPAIQAAAQRALRGGQNLRRTLELVREFRRGDDVTPIILMGYYNPIYVYGVARFLADAKTSGVDGLIVVDLPPEEDEELCLPALNAGFNFIRLATPTTDDRRLPAVLANTSGFVYYVSITGITGAAAPDAGKVAAAVARIKRHTKLPVCVGFGVRTAEQARALAHGADGVVVGSALVEAVRTSLGPDGKATAKAVAYRASPAKKCSGSAEALADGVRRGAQALLCCSDLLVELASGAYPPANFGDGVEIRRPDCTHNPSKAGGDAPWPAMWPAIGCGRKRARCWRAPNGCTARFFGPRACRRGNRLGSRPPTFWRQNSRFWRWSLCPASTPKASKLLSKTANW